MNVAICLPNYYYKPGGGAKVALEYANSLSQNGNKVTIYYYNGHMMRTKKLPALLKLVVKKLVKVGGEIVGSHLWFPLDKNVREVIIDNYDEIESADIVVATAVQQLSHLLAIKQRFHHMVYLIQGLETWVFPEDKLGEYYRLPFEKIVISKWLFDKVYELSGEKCTLIPNTIDTSIFYDKKMARKKHSLIFHYRSSENKGCIYAIQAISELKKLYPDLFVNVISTEKKCPTFPNYYTLYKNITPKEVSEINNSSEVFLCTSIEEGFGLPGLEAMACGTVLVTSGYKAVYDYAIHGMNALISPVKDVKSMVENVVQVFESSELREKLSTNGIATGIERSRENSNLAVNCFLNSLNKGKVCNE